MTKEIQDDWDSRTKYKSNCCNCNKETEVVDYCMLSVCVECFESLWVPSEELDINIDWDAISEDDIESDGEDE